jgi:hypothetical protein
MFGKKERKLKLDDQVFTSKPDGEFTNIIFGTVTGIDGDKIGISGFMINPVGLKNKVSQGKAGERSLEILKEPTSENCILALVYRIEYENFNGVLDLETDKVEIISKRVFSILDGWIRESLSELINNILSLPDGSDKEQAKRVLKLRMENLYDKNLKSNLYSICRSLKILT